MPWIMHILVQILVLLGVFLQATAALSLRPHAQKPHDGSTLRSASLVARESNFNLERRAKWGPEDTAVTPIMMEHMHPIIHREAKRVRLYYGPFKIFGQKEGRGDAQQGMDPNGVNIDQTITGFCMNCTVLSAKTDTYYLNGTRASISTGIYDHHILILDPQKRTLPWWLCEGQTGLGETTAAGFMVTGVDEAPNLYNSPGGEFQSGYWIGEGRKFSLSAELINYRDEAQEVYITTETEFLEGKIAGWRDASMSLLSVTGCSSPDFHPKHGEMKNNMTSPTFRMPKAGTIINMKGHLHDAGVSISLSVNNQTVCESKAIYGGDGSSAVGPDGKAWQTIHQMTQCTQPVAVKVGDVLSVKSVYDTTLHPLRKTADGHGEGDEMGTFFINFVPS